MLTRFWEKMDSEYQNLKAKLIAKHQAKIDANGGKTDNNIVNDLRVETVAGLVDVANASNDHAVSSVSDDDHVKPETNGTEAAEPTETPTQN